MVDRLCYNRGCGKNYNPRSNPDDACKFHPGHPYFHDAYKGWSCCQLKSTDFTVFLNFPGCTLGKHSDVKPVEPEKITGNLEKDSSPEAVVEHRPPVQESLPRPSIDTPLARLTPSIAPSLKQQQLTIQPPASQDKQNGEKNLNIGETCKNSGCKAEYSGPESDGRDCKHHPGIPVFHEGMKYWSCCQRKTSEFQQFLEQEGCDVGYHKWVKEVTTGTQVECRYDWHQTATHVVVTVYAKKYDPSVSTVDLNPVRLKVHLYFPLEKGAFDLDSELCGVVDVENCSCSMMGTKLEIKMKKANPGSWSKLEIVKAVVKPIEPEVDEGVVTESECQVDALDLDDIDLSPRKFQLSDNARTQLH